MKKLIFSSAISFLALMLVSAGLKPGDKAVPFSLMKPRATLVK